MRGKSRLLFSAYPGELEEWIECSILNPLRAAWCDPHCAPEYAQQVIALVNQAVQQRLLEAYQTGQQAAVDQFYMRR